jgi:hypothetical protein
MLALAVDSSLLPAVPINGPLRVKLLKALDISLNTTFNQFEKSQ